MNALHTRNYSLSDFVGIMPTSVGNSGYADSIIAFPCDVFPRIDGFSAMLKLEQSTSSRRLEGGKGMSRSHGCGILAADCYVR